MKQCRAAVAVLATVDTFSGNRRNVSPDVVLDTRRRPEVIKVFVACSVYAAAGIRSFGALECTAGDRSGAPPLLTASTDSSHGTLGTARSWTPVSAP